MTDMEKFIKLLDEVGIEYTVEDNTIRIEDCDGAEDFGISFWDGGGCFPKGKFHEFWVVPER